MASFSPGNILSSSDNLRTFSSGVSDLFGGFGDLEKAKGMEAAAYRQAAQFAGEEAQLSQENTRIQEVRANRELYQQSAKRRRHWVLPILLNLEVGWRYCASRPHRVPTPPPLAALLVAPSVWSPAFRLETSGHL